MIFLRFLSRGTNNIHDYRMIVKKKYKNIFNIFRPRRGRIFPFEKLKGSLRAFGFCI